MITSEENEAKHLGGCCYDCAASETNRYIKRNGISEEERAARLATIVSEEVSA